MPPAYRSLGELIPSVSKQQAEAPTGQKWSNCPMLSQNFAYGPISPQGLPIGKTAMPAPSIACSLVSTPASSKAWHSRTAWSNWTMSSASPWIIRIGGNPLRTWLKGGHPLSHRPPIHEAAHPGDRVSLGVGHSGRCGHLAHGPAFLAQTPSVASDALSPPVRDIDCKFFAARGLKILSDIFTRPEQQPGRFYP